MRTPTSSTDRLSTRLGDPIRITVIATGFSRTTQAVMDFDNARNDLFRLHGAGARYVHVQPEPSHVSGCHVVGLHAHRDEEYIPDFLRRR